MKENRDDIKSQLYYMDEILHKISSMSQAENEKQLDNMTLSMLKSIGKYTAADRAYVFEWSSEKKESFKNTFEWCAAGIEPQIQNLQEVPVCLMQNWVETFIQKKNIIIYDLEEIAKETPQEYEILKPQNIHSLIAMPIYTNHKFIGFIGLDNPNLNQDRMSMNLLSDVGCHLGSVRENLRMMKELMIKNRILSGLSRDYTTAFVLNLDTDEYEFVFNQKTNHAQKHEELRAFSDYVDAYASTFALPEFRDVMRRELDRNEIKKHFETEDEYHFSFETSPNAAGLSCFQAHIVKEYEEGSHFAFLGFRSIDEIVQKERFYKDSLQKVNQALKHQLDMITSALPGGVKISNDDPEYSFKYVSEHFAQMLGYDTPEELMEASGGTIVDLAHPDDLEQGIAQALEQYSKADHYEITYRMRCKNGSWKYIEDRGHKIRKPDGVIEHWNLILDKNELVEKTIALESEKKANQSKSDFLSRMSHDMRTPLNGIIGLMDICMKHPEDRILVDSSRLKARVAADHLLSLINDTLELSKLENEEVKLAKEDFYLPELLHEVETIAQMRADEECITIHFMDAPYSIPYPNLIGSSLHVKQIFLNLITNSIKYNHKNGTVDCYLKEEKESDERVLVDVTIKDTGIGMSEDFLKDIFRPFVQADQGARSQYKGTGLGMAIVKELLDRMGGTIQIDSVENQGTTIHVVIPFEIAEEPAAVQEMSELPKENLSGCRILLAEDNELNREIAAFLLKDEGISVTEAEDGQQAVECFLKMPEGYYDAVLMDIMMPVMDGYQAARAIRGSGKKDAEMIPIVAITANAFAEDKRKTMEAGMDAHLSKPLNVQELMDTIRKFCAGKQICQ
ncbi:ATP-binding protein [Mediterraneibacter sp. NSJ-151]|uniref:PAS domain-containing hybrid sensor histidine kinase/response regulator n=1 Tax=Mediterraneibacter sp. NSJ-151 TaxID=2897708 RepID=UPI001F0AD037|nr:PAS domain-containing hybrid sensor histidine kinase/response regulator [Mediterraneibacter sp. NSJ-151]MCH4279844.1 ATP-binding protein [Mediterraneibacter sp. NSJ-151]